MAGLAAREHGVLSLDELCDCGLSNDAVERRAERGHLRRLHAGVYLVGATLTRDGRWLAAIKACGPDARLSHFSAAAALGLVAWDGRAPEVTVPGPGTRVVRGVRVHRGAIAPHERVRRNAIPMTTAVRTACDLAAILDERALRRAVREGLSLGRFTVTQLRRTHRKRGARRGSARLARVLAAAEPTRSELEDAVLDLALAAIPGRPEVNRPLRLGRRRVIPDLRYPALRLVIEADGAAFHDDALARHDDAERQALLERHGDRVERVTWADAIQRTGATSERLCAAASGAAAPAPRAAARQAC